MWSVHTSEYYSASQKMFCHLQLEAIIWSEISWPEVWLTEAGSRLLRGYRTSVSGRGGGCLFSELLHSIVNRPNS